MIYVTLQELVDYVGERELVELTDRAGTGWLDERVVEQAVAKAEGDLHAAAGRYRVPLTAWDDFVKRLVLDLARFYLYEEAATDRVKAAYDTARADLRAIADGRLQIVGAATADGGADGGTAHVAPGRTFDRASLEDYL